MFSYDLWYVLVWIALLLFLQFALFISTYKKLGDISLPLSFTGSILIFALLSWYCVQIGVAFQYAILFFIGLFVLGFYYQKRAIPIFQGWQKYYAVFLFCFIIFLVTRILSPNILGSEKFMDFAYIHSLYRYPVFPPVDVWYGGEPFNVYYYYGYWIFSSLGSFAKIPPQILFNLAIPTIAAVTAVNLYAIGKIALKKYSSLLLILLFLPDPALFWQFFSNNSLLDIYDSSMHVIYGTLNEYMAASFIIANVHPHFIAFIVQTYLILILLYCFYNWNSISNQSRLLLSGLLVVSLGVLPPLNTWNVFLFAPLFVITGIWIVFFHSSYIPLEKVREGIHDFTKSPRLLLKNWVIQTKLGILFLIGVSILSILLYAPYYLQSLSRIMPISFVKIPSLFDQFLLVWGFFFCILYACYWKEIRKFPWLLLLFIPGLLSGYSAAICGLLLIVYAIMRRNDFADLMVIIGCMGIVFCEFFYLNDYTFETIFRFNTVFKIYSTAWILLGCASLIFVGRYLESRDLSICGQKCIQVFIVIVVIAGITSFVPINILLYGVSDSCGLRGDAFLEKSVPYDAEAISFLRNMTGSHIIVEPVEMYNEISYQGRISVFTGIPTILGWYGYENHWRSFLHGSQDLIERVIAVKMIYENPQFSLYLMDLFNADLLYVGPVEHHLYNVSLPSEGFNIIYDKDGVQILQRNSIPSHIPDNESMTTMLYYPDLNQMNEDYKNNYRNFVF